MANGHLSAASDFTFRGQKKKNNNFDATLDFSIC